MSVLKIKNNQGQWAQVMTLLAQIDPTLTKTGMAADAKVTGDGIRTLQNGGYVADQQQIQQKVDNWLNAHPEATTSVQDWSLSYEKLVKGTTGFVTPEMFGAVGDGETDDTDSIRAALDYAIANGCELKFAQKTYIVTPKYNSGDYCAYSGVHHALYIGEEESVVIDLNNASIKIGQNNEDYVSLFFCFFANGVVIKNGTLIGDRYNTSYGTGSGNDASKLLDFFDCINMHIVNVTMIESKGDGMGYNGKGKNQPTVPDVVFRDVYANNTVRDCVIKDCRRTGITITKGRGLYFENCLMEDLGEIAPGSGVDIEPYYGNGSVYDLHFTGCIIRDALGGIFAQNCDNIIVDHCRGLGFMARHTFNFYVCGNNYTGNISVYSGTGVIIGNKTSQITYSGRNNVVFTEGEKSLHIIDNVITGGVGIQMYFADTAPLVLDVVEIRGNYISRFERHAVDVGSANTTINFKKLIIKDNVIERYGSAFDYQMIMVKNIKDIDIINNLLLYEYKNIGGTQIAIMNVTDGILNLSNNKSRFPRVNYEPQEYADFYPKWLLISNCGNLTALIQGNYFNIERYNSAVRRNKFIETNALTNSHLTIIDNYCYGLQTFIDPSTNVVLCVRNIFNDEEYMYTPLEE